jgi:hypothetical protein
MLTRIKHHPVMVVVVNLAKIHIFILFLFPFQSFCLPSSSLEKYSQIKCHQALMQALPLGKPKLRKLKFGKQVVE